MPFPNQELSPGPPWQRCGAPFENDGNGAYSASSAAVGQGVGSAVWLMIDCTSPGASLPFCGVLPSPNRLMTSAARPATCGDDMDVPWRYESSAVGYVGSPVGS